MKKQGEDEFQDMAEEMANDLASTRREEDPRRASTYWGSDFRANPWILAGACVIIGLLLVALFFSGWREGPPEDLKALRTELNRIGERLTRLESVGKRVAQLEKGEKRLERASARAEKSILVLSKAVHQIKKKTGSLEKKLAALSQTTRASRGTSKKAAPRTGARYHVVQPKENLTWIAQKYGMTLKELCRLNNITRNHVIRPGQKLLVAPGK